MFIFIFIFIFFYFSLPSKFLSKPLRVLEDEVNKTKQTNSRSLHDQMAPQAPLPEDNISKAENILLLLNFIQQFHANASEMLENLLLLVQPNIR